MRKTKLKYLVSNLIRYCIDLFLLLENKKKLKNNFNQKIIDLTSEINLNGFVVLDNCIKKNTINNIKKKIDKLISSETGITKTGNQIKIKEPLLSVPEIYEILKKPIFHHLAKKFFNSEKVRITSLNLRKSMVSTNQANGTELYHTDRTSLKPLKIFCYLNDVDIDGGPTVIIKNSSNLLNRPLASFFNYRLSDKTINSYYKKKDIIYLTSNSGTVQIANTSCIHKGLQPEKNDRYMLTINFGTHKERNTRNFTYKKNDLQKYSFSRELFIDNVFYDENDLPENYIN